MHHIMSIGFLNYEVEEDDVGKGVRSVLVQALSVALSSTSLQPPVPQLVGLHLLFAAITNTLCLLAFIMYILCVKIVSSLVCLHQNVASLRAKTEPFILVSL